MMKSHCAELMPNFAAKPFTGTGTLASVVQAEFDANALGLASMSSHEAFDFVRDNAGDAEAFRDELDARIARLEAATAIYKAARIQVVQALFTLDCDDSLSAGANRPARMS